MKTIISFILIFFPVIVGVFCLVKKYPNKKMFLLTVVSGIISGLVIQLSTPYHAHVPFVEWIYFVVELVLGILVGACVLLLRFFLKTINDIKKAQ